MEKRLKNAAFPEKTEGKMNTPKKEYLTLKISMIFHVEDVLCSSKDDGTADVYTTKNGWTWTDTNIQQ